MKKTIKKLIKKIPIAFTKNQQYDKQTLQIIKKVCNASSNCIDVGAHKGEVLDQILKFAPKGTHFAFEPIPSLYEGLKEKYRSLPNCRIHDIALSNNKGTSTFNYVVSNPSYSGLVKRKYDRDNEQDTQITVKTDLMDDVIPAGTKIALVKIDVEGGELLVMEGARRVLSENKPIVIFEHGLGASDFYGSTPEKLYQLLAGCGLKISRLKDWLSGDNPLSLQQFQDIYSKNSEYYFVAHP
ncbi:MAG: FkbM family methyltransferase [Flavipsychrobacter sp.]|nr:FkbM family methyltransferase [Flavipsychrobacter sp.]